MGLADLLNLRQHKRFMVNLEVTLVETVTGREMEGRIREISRTGMLLESIDSFNGGAALDIWFFIPAEPGHEEPPVIIATGKVSHCTLQTKGQFFDVGVALKTLDGEGRGLYERYLARLAGNAS